jgi:hypothetical protein
MHFSRSHDAVIHVYDDASDVIETHEHKGDCQKFIDRAHSSGGSWCADSAAMRSAQQQQNRARILNC